MKTSKKVSTRNNLLCKLTNWSGNARPFRRTAMALCFSTAEYCCPAWERLTHRKKVDFPFGNRMYSVNTNFRPSTTQWNSSTSYTQKYNITERAEQTDSRPSSQPLRARTNCISTKFAERLSKVFTF